MRDVGPKWSAVPDWSDARLAGRGVSVEPVAGLRQVAVSGDLEAGLAALAPGIAPIGPREVAGDGLSALWIASDRVMLVGPQVDFAPGLSAWRDGYGVTDLSESLAVFEINGPAHADLLARGTTLDLLSGSKGGSVAVNFAHRRVYLYRRESGARIHIERSYATYLHLWFETAMKGLPGTGRR